MNFENFVEDMTNTITSQTYDSAIYPNPEFVNNDFPDSGTVHMCFFTIDQQCIKPFVKIAVATNSDSKTVHLPVLENLDNNFEVACSQLAAKIIKNSNQLTISEHYRGYIISEGMTYVFYDILSYNSQLQDNYKYMITSELAAITKSVWSCDDVIKSLFNKDNMNQDGLDITMPVYPKLGTYNYIEAPLIGYLCMTDEKDRFISLTDLEQQQIYVPVDALINIKNVGHYYYFSDTIIEPEENEFYIRYAIFPMNSINTDSVFSSKSFKALNGDQYNSIVFYLNKNHNVKICAIKSPDQFIAL